MKPSTTFMQAILISACATLPYTAWADLDPIDPPNSERQQISELDFLTADQQQVLDTHRTEMDTLRADQHEALESGEITREEIRTERENNRESFRTENPELAEALDANRPTDRGFGGKLNRPESRGDFERPESMREFSQAGGMRGFQRPDGMQQPSANYGERPQRGRGRF